MKRAEWRIFIVILLFRLSSIYFVRTSYVSEEWQALEVAHNLTYGYGNYTWEYDKKMKSCLYPFIMHLLYKVIPESPIYIIYSPRVFQAVLSTIGDLFCYKFTVKLFGKNCGRWALFNILTSWFLFYCSSRTLTSMAEASLTSYILFSYPWCRKRRRRLTFNYMWALTIFITPLKILVWSIFCYSHLLRAHNTLRWFLLTFAIGFTVQSAKVFIDRKCYGEWVLTSYNSLSFYWWNSLSAFYETHNILWYFYRGLPTILGLHVILLVCGIFCRIHDRRKNFRKNRFFLILIWMLIVYSLSGQKELHFLLPILHLCLVICGILMNEIWCERVSINGTKIRRKFLVIFAISTILFNASLSCYMGFYHRRGVIDAARHLSETVKNDSNVLFLMPCHSTPYYSYIHKAIKMKFLTCEPNFKYNASYVNEEDEFFDNPSIWLSKNYRSRYSSVPSHIVLFDTLYSNVSVFLKYHRYHKCFTAFHSHFGNRRIGKYVDIYCK